MRRSVVSTTHLPVGHILTHNDVTLKDREPELKPEEMDSLIGCEVTRAIEADTLLSKNL